MQTVNVVIGSAIVVMGMGADDFAPPEVVDDRQRVEFEAEIIGQYNRLTDEESLDRLCETLYRTADGRLIVHSADLPTWATDRRGRWTLREIREADLRPGGRFQALGARCGYGRPLTLDEALAQS